MATYAQEASIKKKYALLHTQLVRKRDADLRGSETKRKADLSTLETKHKNEVQALGDQFREDSLSLNVQEKDEIDALTP